MTTLPAGPPDQAAGARALMADLKREQAPTTIDEVRGGQAFPQTSSAPGPWLVWSNEHLAWWRPARCGYTKDVKAAGRYDYAEARDICDRACYRAGSENVGTGVPPEVMVPSPEFLAAIDAA